MNDQIPLLLILPVRQRLCFCVVVGLCGSLCVSIWLVGQSLDLVTHRVRGTTPPQRPWVAPHMLTVRILQGSRAFQSCLPLEGSARTGARCVNVFKRVFSHSVFTCDLHFDECREVFQVSALS